MKAEDSTFKKGLKLGKKYKNLIDKIVNIDNMRNAYLKAVRGGNRYTIGHLKFKENLEANLYQLQQLIINGSYTHGSIILFLVHEPKERLIKSLPFKDRVVQHAINNILESIFEKVFYSFSFACRKNKGTHIGAKMTQSKIRHLEKSGAVYYLKMDFSKYFHSIDRSILFNEIEKKISDPKVLELLKNLWRW